MSLQTVQNPKIFWFRGNRQTKASNQHISYEMLEIVNYNYICIQVYWPTHNLKHLKTCAVLSCARDVCVLPINFTAQLNQEISNRLTRVIASLLQFYMYALNSK